MNEQHPDSSAPGPGWNSLFLIGGAAALLAGVLFRRNLGAEIGLFSPVAPPTSPIDWLLLLQTHRVLGLAYLGIFDVVNAILVGVMLLALYKALRCTNPGLTLIAAALGFLGVTVYLATNTAFSMLALSDQYAASTSEAQRTLLLPAAQALLALNRFTNSAHPGSGGYISLLLIAASGWIFSLTFLRNPQLGRWAAITGIFANSLDLLYCLAFPFSPSAVHTQLAMLFIPAAGLFFMAWHILVGVRLLQFAGLFQKSGAMSRPVDYV